MDFEHCTVCYIHTSLFEHHTAHYRHLVFDAFWVGGVKLRTRSGLVVMTVQLQYKLRNHKSSAVLPWARQPNAVTRQYYY